MSDFSLSFDEKLESAFQPHCGCPVVRVTLHIIPGDDAAYLSVMLVVTLTAGGGHGKSQDVFRNVVSVSGRPVPISFHVRRGTYSVDARMKGDHGMLLGGCCANLLAEDLDNITLTPGGLHA